MTKKKTNIISHRFACFMRGRALVCPIFAIPILAASISGMNTAHADGLNADVNIGKMASQAGLKKDDWLFLPSVVSGIKYDSSLFKSNTDKVNDLILYTAPKTVAVKKFKSGNLTFEVESLLTRYLYNDEFSAQDLTGSMSGVFQITPRSSLSFSSSLARTNELPSSVNQDDPDPITATGPIANLELDVSAQLSTTFKRFTSSIKVGYTNTDYEDIGAIDQDIRNSEKYSISKDLSFVVSRHIKVVTSGFVEATYNPNNPLRDVTTYGGNTELQLVLSSKLSAAFNFGLTKDDFHSAADSDLQPSFEASIAWQPTRHLTFSVNASQDETSTNFQESAGSIKKNSVSGEVSYNVNKNLSVKASSSFKTSDISQDNRTVDELDLELSAQYALNRNMGFVVIYTHDKREASDSVGDFERDTVQGSFVAKF